MIPGDGNIPNAMTDLNDVGRYVALIIADERTLNKMVFAYNEVLTANQAYGMMESLSGEKIARNYVSIQPLINLVPQLWLSIVLPRLTSLITTD